MQRQALPLLRDRAHCLAAPSMVLPRDRSSVNKEAHKCVKHTVGFFAWRRYNCVPVAATSTALSISRAKRCGSSIFRKL